MSWLLCLPFAASVLAAAPQSFSQLRVGDAVYQDVRVTDVTPQAVIIVHSRGMSQVQLRDLSAELQQAFGYSAAAEQEYLAATRRKHELAMAKAASARKRRAHQSNNAAAAGSSPVQSALSRFGQAPVIRNEVDLRPEFWRLELGSKNQGRRPSCSVFAVVSALEFQNAQLDGNTDKLSEEYLIWATMQSLGLRDEQALQYDEDAIDAGFGLLEVVQALRTYGIPTHDAMPNTYGKSMADIEPPSDEIIEEARRRSKVHAYLITGRDQVTKINNIVHILNEGAPVVIGVQWPVASTLYNAPVLSKQKPRDDYAHAVTLVGYRSDKGDPTSLRFVFKNSWGNKWGLNGYGWVTYAYLQQHLHAAVVLDVGG